MEEGENETEGQKETEGRKKVRKIWCVRHVLILALSEGSFSEEMVLFS